MILCVFQKVDMDLVNSWMDYLSLQPRAAQLLTKDSPELANLQLAMNRHLKDVKRHMFKADKRFVRRRWTIAFSILGVF